jgi:prepilin-type N-terminal cleavage/methylation domain-containing protein
MRIAAPSPQAVPARNAGVPPASLGTAGFTLMELIIVLTILAMMSAAVVPIFGGTFATVQSDHAVRDLVATIKYAQERAVTDMKEYRLYLDPATNAYFLLSVKNPDERTKQFEALSERQGETVVLPERLKLGKSKAKKDRSRNMAYVAFYPNGACDKATLAVVRDDGLGKHIETEGSLGRINVSEKWETVR